MRRQVLVLALVTITGVLAASCGASEDSAEPAEGEGTEQPSEGASTDGDTADYGVLEDVCGDGDFTVDPDEQGVDNGKLNIGVATDRTSDLRPGLNKEMWDASVAFAEWCNSHGGIGGLEIELVELPGALLEVESAMITACSDVFAMVGGGFAQDNFVFSGNEGSDFHECGMIDIPGFAVSPEKSGANGQVNPVPNPATETPNTWMRDFMELYPEESQQVVVVYNELPSLALQKDRYEVAIEDVGMELLGTFPYPVTVTDWNPYAQQVVDSGATTLMFVGEPGNAASLLAKLDEQDWDGIPLLETNMYDPLLFAQGDAGPEGAVIRSTINPLGERADWPTTDQYLGLLEEHVPDHKAGPLGVLSTSAWLLFATAAEECGEANDGVLDRTCILEQAAAVEDWTGGELHARTDPEGAETATGSNCSMLLEASGGEFVRLYPEVGGEGDDGGGFHCPSNGVTPVPENEGKGRIDPDRPI